MTDEEYKAEAKRLLKKIDDGAVTAVDLDSLKGLRWDATTTVFGHDGVKTVSVNGRGVPFSFNPVQVSRDPHVVQPGKD